MYVIELPNDILVLLMACCVSANLILTSVTNGVILRNTAKSNSPPLNFYVLNLFFSTPVQFLRAPSACGDAMQAQYHL